MYEQLSEIGPHFGLSETQKMVKQSVREFAEAEIAPNIKEWDQSHTFHKPILKKMADQGILGLSIPVKYGGGGLDYISLAIACEELERIDTAFRVILSVHNGLVTSTIWQWGDMEQKKKYLPILASGEKMSTFGLTEASAGSDPAGLKTTCYLEGDEWVINGEKMWISYTVSSDIFLVFAYEIDVRHKGMRAFIVERDFGGVTTGNIDNKMGVKAGETGWMHLDETRVPKENILGLPDEGFKVAMAALDWGRYTVAGGAVGGAKASLEAAVEYANERETFGKKIGQHQFIQGMIADCVSDIEAAELLTWKAGWTKNLGKVNTRETALAKWYATNAAVRCADRAIQIHGAYGFCDDYPVARYYRNVRGATIYEGTNEIQKIIQARYALGYYADKPLRCMPPKYDPDEWAKENTDKF
ncbi:MAG: acyl-CoA dehydrogenase family protein [Candidatus Heimdallarchaeota archaeon]|nr:acyl-CoA dehydrogenase family protein [Candidatus Heimdallarchaeota archaeon]MCK4253542.1 acyl-CoA dehydrogenase family protein [Candidatus Heimdallarchaeota archaeon]